MAFNRTIMPATRPNAQALTAQMVGVGMNFSADADRDANIEDTLVFASELGMDEDDLRVLAVLVTWLGVHHGYLNADRLVRVVRAHSSVRVRAFWSAVAAWQRADRRLTRLLLPSEAPINLLRIGSDFQMARRGEDARFVGATLRIPAGILRDRAADVLTPEALARQHLGYHNRVCMGASYRADAWTAVERIGTDSIAEVARRAYCSFATAWQVARDHQVVRAQAGSRLHT